MALPTNLNTNEIKDASGTEVEFNRRGPIPNGVEFYAASELPNLPHRLSFRHELLGKGLAERRRSNQHLVLSILDDATGLIKGKIVVDVTVDIPVGMISDYDDVKKALAESMSALASDGSSTTIKFDCTGTGASALINGLV